MSQVPPPYSIWIPILPSCLSIMGSTAIIYIIASDRRRKLARPKNRLMLCMSIMDVLQCIALACTTLPLPQSEGVYGALGTYTTFRIQVFFVICGWAVPLYNSSLNLLYLLTIRYNMTPLYFASTMEPLLHTVSILVPLSVSILVVTRYWESIVQNSSSSSSPITLALIFSKSSSLTTTTFITIIVFCVVFTAFSMTCICRSVIRQDNTMKRHSFQRASTSTRTTTTTTTSTSIRSLQRRDTVKQAVLYAVAVLMTYLFPFVLAMVGGDDHHHQVIVLGAKIFYPLQGFWNFVLYIRPGVKHVTDADQTSVWRAIRTVVFDAKSVANSYRRREPTTCRHHTTVGRRTHTIPACTTFGRHDVLNSSSLGPSSNRRTSTAVSFGRFPEDNPPKLLSSNNTTTMNDDTIEGNGIIQNETCGSSNQLSSSCATRGRIRRASLASIASVLSGGGGESLDCDDEDLNCTTNDTTVGQPPNEMFQLPNDNSNNCGTNGISNENEIRANVPPSFSVVTPTRVRRGSLVSIASVLSEGSYEFEEVYKNDDLECNPPKLGTDRVTIPGNEMVAIPSMTHIASVLSEGLSECEEDLEYNEPNGGGGSMERIVKSTGSTNILPSSVTPTRVRRGSLASIASVLSDGLSECEDVDDDMSLDLQ